VVRYQDALDQQNGGEVEADVDDRVSPAATAAATNTTAA